MSCVMDPLPQHDPELNECKQSTVCFFLFSNIPFVDNYT
jgi:hypothetical protein